jgi:small-conductance mechanosensitive channel
MSALPWLSPSATGPGLHIALTSLVAAFAILVAAWLFNWLVRRALERLCCRYDFAPAFAIGTRRVIGFLVYAMAFVAILQLLGVSGSALWGTLTGFVAVGAVAFFAAWSVLSNSDTVLQIPNSQFFQKITRRWR